MVRSDGRCLPIQSLKRLESLSLLVSQGNNRRLPAIDILSVLPGAAIEEISTESFTSSGNATLWKWRHPLDWGGGVWKCLEEGQTKSFPKTHQPKIPSSRSVLPQIFLLRLQQYSQQWWLWSASLVLRGFGGFGVVVVVVVLYPRAEFLHQMSQNSTWVMEWLPRGHFMLLISQQIEWFPCCLSQLVTITKEK